jgi:hypothetical protein
MARMENLKDKAETKQSQAENPTVYVIAGSNGD